MPAVPEVGAPVSPLLVAALLLAAGEHLRTLGLPHPTVQQVIEATGASRSRAYELRDAMLVGLASLLRPVGRPPAPTRAVEPDTVHELRGDVMTFVMSHPGCVYGGAERRRYDDTFRRFVLDLREQHPDLDHALVLEDMARLLRRLLPPRARPAASLLRPLDHLPDPLREWPATATTARR